MISAALLTAGAASPAAAGGESGIAVQILHNRSAYSTATTLQFLILDDSDHAHPLTSEQNYALAAELGLSRIELLAGDRVVGTATEQPWTIAWDPSDLPEGPVLLTARSYDRDGRKFQSGVPTSVDRTPPTLRVYNNGFVKAGGEVYVEAADQSGLNGFDLLSGDRLLDTSLGNPALLHWDPAAVDGPATLVVRARDIAGNVAEHRRSVLVDNVPPVVTVTPAAKAYVRGTASFALTALRDASGLGGLEVQFNGTWHAATGRVAKVNTRVAADGSRTVRWSVRDQAGNVTDVRRTVTVDNHAPAVAYGKAPKNKAKVKKTFAITAKATDSYGVAKVQLLVNGRVVATDSKAGYSFKINPKKYGRTFTVQLRAYDKAGNVKAGSKRTYRR